ncbi:serine protease inhibitor A3M [Nematolebias whitei]|uniref:serine protease inhibitor A3M n=1 Tax=Nematolebias whitei TaxID=451745 RepID=UPI00189BC3A4|nr:serine protease inhibitor A3M [Nematolebias whitei]
MVLSANKEFAFRLYRELSGLSDTRGKNVFFSPFCVSGILATLSIGAREETHQQIFNVLGFNNFQLSQTDVEEAFCRIVKSEQAQTITSGTAVFVDNMFEPQPEFLDVLKQFSFVKVFSVDFTKAIDSVNTLNKYVSDKTNGRINKLVDSLNSSTVLYLLNYIYYKGKWPIGFDPALTKLDEFNVDENNKVPVQMMKIEKHFYTFDEEIGTFVLHLPFSNSFSMLLLMPDNMTTLENIISPAHVTEWLNVTESRDCGIYIPKFSIKTSYTLNDVLKEMGMTDMFDHANLNGISKNERNLTSEVVHRAALDVDEAGATAAAAAGRVAFDSACLKPALKFNSPFILMMIIERRTECILFMGKISNPNL